jgi:hypothetical protein
MTRERRDVTSLRAPPRYSLVYALSEDRVGAHVRDAPRHTGGAAEPPARPLTASLRLPPCPVARRNGSCYPFAPSGRPPAQVPARTRIDRTARTQLSGELDHASRGGPRSYPSSHVVTATPRPRARRRRDVKRRSIAGRPPRVEGVQHARPWLGPLGRPSRSQSTALQSHRSGRATEPKRPIHGQHTET